MNIAVLNSSGNVGKTLITKTLLLPNLPNHSILNIEPSFSKTEYQKTCIKLTKFCDLDFLTHTISNENLIIDVHSSYTEKILNIHRRVSGHTDIDLFLLPVNLDPKIIIDTKKTVNLLLNSGVDTSQIVTIINLTNINNNLMGQENKTLNQFCITKKIKLLKNHIEYNSVYSSIKKNGYKMNNEVYDNLIAYIKMMKKNYPEDFKKKKEELKSHLFEKRLFEQSKSNLKMVFNELFHQYNLNTQ